MVLYGAEASVSVVISLNCPVKVSGRKIRPEHIVIVKLGVCRLPDQKVRKPVFAARADNQIRVGLTGGVKTVGDHILGDVLGRKLAVLDFFGNFLNTMYNLVPTAVVDGNIDEHLILVAGVRLDNIYHRNNILGESLFRT